MQVVHRGAGQEAVEGDCECAEWGLSDERLASVIGILLFSADQQRFEGRAQRHSPHDLVVTRVQFRYEQGVTDLEWAGIDDDDVGVLERLTVSLYCHMYGSCCHGE